MSLALDASVRAGFGVPVPAFVIRSALGRLLGADVEVAQRIALTPSPASSVAGLRPVDAGAAAGASLRRLALGLRRALSGVGLGAHVQGAVDAASAVAPEAVHAALGPVDNAPVRAGPLLAGSALGPHAAVLRERLPATVVEAVHLLGNALAAPMPLAAELVAGEAALATRARLSGSALGLRRSLALVRVLGGALALPTGHVAFARAPAPPLAARPPGHAAISALSDVASTAVGLRLFRPATLLGEVLSAAPVVAVRSLHPARTPLAGVEAQLTAFATAGFTPLTIAGPTIGAIAHVDVGGGAAIVLAVHLAAAGCPMARVAALLASNAALDAAPGLAGAALGGGALSGEALGADVVVAVDLATTRRPAAVSAQLLPDGASLAVVAGSGLAISAARRLASGLPGARVVFAVDVDDAAVAPGAAPGARGHPDLALVAAAALLTGATLRRPAALVGVGFGAALVPAVEVLEVAATPGPSHAGLGPEEAAISASSGVASIALGLVDGA